MLVFSCAACDDEFLEDEYESENDAANNVIPEGEVARISGTEMNVDNSTGTLTIHRKEIGNDERTDDGVWTVFVYLCGTDLESQGGMGTADMKEMVASTKSDMVRFVVQTGGTDGWNNDKVDDSMIQRFVIQNGKTKKIDEKYNQDSITLMEMDQALSQCCEKSGRKFDFVGYDACLMGTVETANVLATYSDYMYGSEEMEPGSGWDYTAIGDYLAKNPDAVNLGKVVSDSFYESCKKQKDDSIVTFSVIDLSKIDALLISFNDFAKNMYAVGEDSSEIAEMIRGIEQADNYGGNNKTEGYTNMVDMGGICNACAPYVNGAKEVTDAINDAVLYKVSGATHTAATGLSIYYPLAIQGSNELSLFSKISVSPYYLSFVDRLNKTGATDDGFEDYDDEQWFEDDGSWNFSEDYDDDYWNYLDDYEQTGESPYITFSEEPNVRDDGTYGFTLDENGIDNASGVCALVYEVSEDGNSLIEIGETTDVSGDWGTGSFNDNFDGYWLSLPDGQNLATYVVEETDEYVIYTSPILLNGEPTNLRMIQYYSDDYVEVEGTWDGISQEGAASRDIYKLCDGDVITPSYFSYSMDGEEEDEYAGQDYTVSGNIDINYDMMPAGEYYYSFCIDDIYGDYYVSDQVIFNINEDGEISF